MSARSIGDVTEIVVERARNLALLNAYLVRMPPPYRKRAIMALWQAEVLSDGATELLIEHHQLEAE